MIERKHRIARQHNLQRILAMAGSQAKVADALDVTPSYISQLLNGHRAIGDEMASKIEAAFNLSSGVLDIPPEEVADIGEDPDLSGVREDAGGWAPPTLVSVPSYFAFAGAGPGSPNEQELEVPGGFYFKRASLEKAGLLGKDLSCIFARGQSMEPTLAQGDLLLLEHGVGGISDGKVYAFLWGDDLRCKRLFVQPDGRITIRSDNPDKTRFPDESVSPEEPGFEVVARVCWRGGWV